MMIASTTETLEGVEIAKYLGVVVDDRIISRDVYIEDTEIVHVKEMIVQTLIRKAKRLGANAVINIELSVSPVEGREVILVSGVGTAVLCEEL
jgi:uncharacterized protein YbjQ (UPF0145 family)